MPPEIRRRPRVSYASVAISQFHQGVFMDCLARKANCSRCDPAIPTRRTHTLKRLLLAVFIAVCVHCAPILAQTTDVWKGGAGAWSNASLWTNGVPNGNFNVFIDNGNALASPVTLDLSPSINNLTIDSDDSLSFVNGATLTVNGTSISNAGNISLNSTGNLTGLFVATAATLTGAGKATLSNNSQNFIDGNGGATLTNRSTIRGVGTIGPHFILANKGIINANVAGGILALRQDTGATDTNTATLEATNGGVLQIGTTGGGGGINNTGGTIKAVGTNSQVQFTGFGTSISGGTLSTSSGGLIVQPAGTASTLNGVTNAGTFSILNGATVNLGGTLTNSGSIQLNSTGGPTGLFVPTTATLTGAGTVTLSNNSQNFVDGNGGAMLTNQSTIQGIGTIGDHFVLVNQGTVNANVAGGILALRQDAGATDTNTATLEATNGGILQISTSGGTGGINNTGGTITAVGTGSQVQFTGFGTSISGGTLSTSSGGLIVQPAGTASTLNGVTNAGTFSILNGATVHLSGTLTNNGTIQVNSVGSLTLLNVPTGNVTLSGIGAVVMNNNPNSAIDGNGGLTFTNQSTIQGGGTIGPHVTFSNKGTLNVTAANTLNINAPFVNFSGTTLTGGTYLVSGTLQFNSAKITTNAAKITLSGTGARIIDQTATNALRSFSTNSSLGTFTVRAGKMLSTPVKLSNSGRFIVGPNSGFTPGGIHTYTQLRGSTRVDGVLSAAGGMTVQAGSLLGKGTIASAVQSSGSVTPGDAATNPGKLSINGSYTQTATGALNISIGGPTAGTQYAQLIVSNGVSLNGTLNIQLINGFVPVIGSTFTILTGAAVSGTFATVNGLSINSGEHFQVHFNPTSVTLTVESGP